MGSLTAAYTSAQVDAGETPNIGATWHDDATCKKYIFLENVTATVEASECVVISDASVFQVTPSSVLNDSTFAGVRVASSTDLADTEHGWFQIGGNATCLFGDSARDTVAGEGVVLDDDSDTGRVGGVLLAVTSSVTQALIELALDSVAGVFGTAQATVSTTDATVEVQLHGDNIWGA